MKKISIALCFLLMLSFGFSQKAAAQTAYGYCNWDKEGLIGGEGPITFSLDDPSNITLLTIQGGNPLAASTCINGDWYAVEIVSNRFISIDPTTGARTMIGYTGIPECTGLTYDIYSGTMYAIDVSGSLYTINIVTGNATLISSSGPTELLDLAASTDGVLYAVDMYNQNLWSIDPSTGEKTLVAPITTDDGTQINFYFFQDWDFNFDNNTLYWVGFNADSLRGELWTVNISNGICTKVGNFYSFAWIIGMAIPYSERCLERTELVSPINNAYCIPVTPTFNWTEVPNATSYKIEISTSNDFSTPAFTSDNVITNSYTIPDSNQLAPLTQYWWKVQAFNGPDCSSWFSYISKFFTDGSLPTITLTSPGNENINVPQPVNFDWMVVSGATEYNVQVSTVSDFSLLVKDEIITETKFRALLSLTTQYYWRVRAINPCGNGLWSVTWTFITADQYPSFGYIVNDNGLIGATGPCYYNLSRPDSITLIQDQSDQNYFITGTWKDGVWFNIEYSTNNLVTCDPGTGNRTTIGYTGLPNIVGLTYDYSTNAMYCLRATGQLYTINPSTGTCTLIGGPSNYNFIVLACNQLGILYAADINTYSLYIINKTTGIPALVGPLVHDNGYPMYFFNAQDWDFDLNNNILYWSRNDENGSSPDGQLWTVDPATAICTKINDFQGNAQISGMAIPFSPPCLTTPTLTTPVNDSYCISQTPTLNWDAVPSATTYSLELASNSDFSALLFDEEELTSTYYTIPTTNMLLPITQYWWRIKAHNGSNCLSWFSPVYKFFTEGVLQAPTLISPENGDTTLMTCPIMSWDTIYGATSYHIQLSTTSDFSTLAFNQAGVTNTHIKATELSSNTKYFWRVQALNQCGSASWSSVFNFITGNNIGWIGDGTTYNSSTSYPTPYGRWYRSSREQYLILASEITDLGGTPGDITSLTFNVAALNNIGPIQDFTIKMKMTSVDSMGWWDYTNLIEVAHYDNYMPVLGLNQHNFTTPFLWDGASNILIDVCFHYDGLGPPYTHNASVYYTNYQDWFYPTIGAYSDAMMYWACDPGAWTSVNTYHYRPNMILGFADSSMPTTQSFDLPIGWSMISSFIYPDSPALNNVLTGITDKIIIMKNGEGNNYIPSQGINQIGNWDVKDGYQIKVNAPVQFSITGFAATPETSPIPLIANWNLISYLRQTPMLIASALANFGNSLKIAKNGLGLIYVPSYNINQIGNMNPGEGYYINVNTSGTLLYPANGALKAITGEELSPMPKYLMPSLTRTGSNTSLILKINTDNGDEVGIYNSIDNLIGSGVVQDGIAAITIWGDDKTTEAIEGAVEGELLTVKLLNAVTGEFSNVTLINIKDILTNNEPGQLIYNANGLVTADAVTQPAASNQLSISNMPNPFSGTTTVRYTLPDNGNVEIKIYNLQGELVSELLNSFSTSGEHELNFNSGNLSSGVYNLVMRFGSQQASTMMMIVK